VGLICLKLPSDKITVDFHGDGTGANLFKTLSMGDDLFISPLDRNAFKSRFYKHADGNE
jgi:hypothetical protein